MLSIRPTTLKNIHLIEETAILSLIADKVSRLDVVFGMSAIFSKRYHMIERESSGATYDIWINRLIAYIAMIAISLDNLAKINLFHKGSNHLSTTAVTHTCSNQVIAWLPIFLTIISSKVFQISIIEVTKPYTLFWQQPITVLLPEAMSLYLIAIIALCAVSITFRGVFEEVTKWLLRLAPKTPLVTGGSRNTAPIAILTWIFLALINTINTIFARGSIASCRERISIKVIYSFFISTLFAHQRGKRFTFWRILNVLESLQSALLIPTYFTPRLIAASFWGLFVKLFKGLFDMATSTFFSRKQEELFNMVQFSHGYDLPKGCSLVNGDASNVSINAKSFIPIIPQSPTTSQAKAYANGRLAVL